MYTDFFHMRFRKELRDGVSKEIILREHEERIRHSLPVFRFVYIFASAPPAGTMSAQGAADASGTALLLFAQAEHCCPYDNHENSCHNQTFHCCSFPVSILHIISLQASLSIHFLP